MTAKDLAAYIGRTGLCRLPIAGTLAVEVKIIDARSMFGRVDVKITPTRGTGDAWADVKSITFAKEAR